MRGQLVARRYALALFDLGAMTGETTLIQLSAAMRTLGEAMERSPELAAVLVAPVFSVDEKYRVLVSVLSAVLPHHETPDPVVHMVKNFCGLLADKKRLPLFGEIVRSFDAMLDARRKVLRATLSTAIMLEPARRDAIRADLEHRLKGTLELDYAVEPALLGGLTLRLGDRVLDASLRTQLDALRTALGGRSV